MWRDSGVASNVSSAKRGFPRPVIDVLVLELGCELGGEVVHLHDDPANAGDEKVVTEHCRDRDTERRNGSNQRSRDTGRHCDKIWRSGLSNPAKRVHYAPDRAEQSEKRITRNFVIMIDQLKIDATARRLRTIFPAIVE